MNGLCLFLGFALKRRSEIEYKYPSLLSDSSKINQRSFKQFAKPEDCDYLVTDAHITQEQQNEINALGINLLIV